MEKGVEIAPKPCFQTAKHERFLLVGSSKNAAARAVAASVNRSIAA
ncbi:MAG: hypothetical protein ACRD6X_17850 [Pyrinomonadaceae bacterium]